jgi:predicted porin
MKKSLLALAVIAALPVAVQAQSSTTLGGSISVGVMDTGAAGDKAQVAAFGGGTNAINIMTAEDLGKGMRAGFDGQIRFSPTSGDRGSAGNGNALFHFANLYLTTTMGTVRVGKIVEQANCAFDPWGCTGGAGLVAGLGVGGLGRGLVGAITIQNGLSYATPVIAGFSATIQTSLSAEQGVRAAAAGATNPGQTVGRANERQVISLNYAQGPIAAQFLRTTGAPNSAGDWTSHRPVASANSLVVDPADTKSSAQAISASYNFGFATVMAYNAITKTAAGVKSNDITSIGASIPRGPFTFLLGYAKDNGPTIADNRDTKMSAGVTYALSRRTTLGADVFKAEAAGVTSAAGTAVAGDAGSGFALRARHIF